ncbi:potassium-transporting ATPase subunit KdpA [Escherichia coli]|nr:potassium-transporting ATPase subunit KdpA [Escherichia coli]
MNPVRTLCFALAKWRAIAVEAHVAVGDVGDFVICVSVMMWAEVQGNPHLLALGADSSINMEGKESRFGVLVNSTVCGRDYGGFLWRSDCDA